MNIDDVSETQAIAVAGLVTALVGYADYATGVELRIFPLYFIPIAIVSWTSSRIAGGFSALLCGTVWVGSNVEAGMADLSSVITVANFFVMLLAFLIVAGLISSNKESLRRERLLSRHDMLTGLLNSRGFLDRAATEVSRARRSRGFLTVALLDLDRFKEVNDTFGHASGDALLSEVADICRRRLRSTDIAARLGSDEFAILMPDTDPDGARVVLEIIRRFVANTAAARGLLVTVTAGAYAIKDVPADVDALLRKADETMYKAKRAGRNRVVVDVVESDAADFSSTHQPVPQGLPDRRTNRFCRISAIL